MNFSRVGHLLVPTLTSLSIGGWSRHHDSPQMVLRALGGMPLLRALELRGWMVSGAEDTGEKEFSRCQDVHLSHLRDLVIGTARYDRRWRSLLHHLSFPSTTRVSFLHSIDMYGNSQWAPLNEVVLVQDVLRQRFVYGVDSADLSWPFSSALLAMSKY